MKVRFIWIKRRSEGEVYGWLTDETGCGYLTDSGWWRTDDPFVAARRALRLAGLPDDTEVIVHNY